MKTRFEPKYIAASVPYVAVIAGLYLLSNVWVTMAMYHVGVLLFMALRKGGPSWRTLKKGWRSRLALPLLVVCAANGLAIYLAFPSAGLSSTELSVRMADMGVGGWLWAALFVYYVGVTPWLEELFWRGHLGSNSASLAVSDVLFAGYHVLVLAKFLKWPWVALSFVTLVSVAWVWRQIKARSGGLFIPVTTHLVADASTMIAVFVLAIQK